MRGHSLRLLMLGAVCTYSMYGQEAVKPESSQAGNTRPPQLSSRQASPEMQSLTKTISGRWLTKIKYEDSETTPNGGVGDGEQIWRSGPGGFTLLEEEHIHAPYGERFLLALMWWDKTMNRFRGMLCNGSGPAGCNVESTANSVLQWDGKQLIIDMEFPSSGKRMMWHEVFRDFTSTSFLQTGDIGEVGGPLQRRITINATKAADIGSEFSN
jgi:hypothetical protein